MARSAAGLRDADQALRQIIFLFPAPRRRDYAQRRQRQRYRVSQRERRHHREGAPGRTRQITPYASRAARLRPSGTTLDTVGYVHLARGEAREVPRLFIADNSALANGVGGPNPTLTTQAVATRTAEQIFQRYFGGDPWVASEAPVSSVDRAVTDAVIELGL